MWDWIVVCNIVNEALIKFSTSLFLFYISVGAYFLVTTPDDKEFWKLFVGKMVENLNSVIFLAVLFTIISIYAVLPKILVTANIDRVKIHYTSPQAISKIESGALKVVDKLDKLIDKGINSIGEKKEK